MHTREFSFNALKDSLESAGATAHHHKKKGNVEHLFAAQIRLQVRPKSFIPKINIVVEGERLEREKREKGKRKGKRKREKEEEKREKGKEKKKKVDNKLNLVAKDILRRLHEVMAVDEDEVSVVGVQVGRPSCHCGVLDRIVAWL